MPVASGGVQRHNPAMPYDIAEILETIHMTRVEHLDIRTVTLGISLRDCADRSIREACGRIEARLMEVGGNLVSTVDRIQSEFGVPIANRRIAVTPLAIVGDGFGREEFLSLAETLDRSAAALGIDYIGGFSALVQKGATRGDWALLDTIPDALAKTERVCSSVNVASTRAGINMDAVARMGQVIRATAEATADRSSVGCAKLTVFCNIPDDNPFVAGAMHGVSEPDAVINVGISGPGVVLQAIEQAGSTDLGSIAETIKRTAFKVTRMGELVGRKVSERLGVEFGIVDLSLAPTPADRDSVARVVEALGIERIGAPGSTAALALVNDAVKKGGAMASSYVGGMSGAFIPVAEDASMVSAVEAGALSLEKLEAMTSVCSVGLDMVAVPGDTSVETIAALLADEMAIGCINNKTTSVRIIPAIGKTVGERLEFGGLLGTAPVMPISRFRADAFVQRGGRIPASLQALTN
jgi:uncharacterized protein (UPF0210 family)